MLVLSRRCNEKIVFPTINATVQVIGLKSGQVRLGIEAPSDLAVFREEVLARMGPEELAGLASSRFPDLAAPSQIRELRHQFGNRLNAATIGLALARRQAQAGLTRETLATIAKIEPEFAMLQQQMEVMTQRVAPQPLAKPARALLVEDDQNECELTAGFLRLVGVEVATAGDGAAALEYLHAHERPDVVLLDMVLPRCDGPSMVRTIRRNPAYAGLKIFGLTGHAPDQFGLDSGSTGVDRWFRKPLNPEALLQELNQELRRAS